MIEDFETVIEGVPQQDYQSRVVFKLNADITETFNDMVEAKNLFLAKSSLSYMAGIINRGNVFFQEGKTDHQTSIPLKTWNIWGDVCN
jgi:hypothetical protein